LIIFTTQPLLWGHAFINPKDIPFMFFFTCSVLLGFKMVDSVQERPIQYFYQYQPKLAKRLMDFFKTNKGIDLNSLLKSLAIFFTNFINPSVIIAGVALGMATSVRVLGPIAGLSVILFLLIKVKDRREFITFTFGYAIWAAITVYLTWPFLWSSPISRFIDSVRIMAKFPWESVVLFNGQFITPDNLPVSYLPVLLNIQFTEPFLVLFYIGLIFLAWKFRLYGNRPDLILYISICSIVPLLGVVVFHPPIYDNFRQFFFLIPPLFIVAGITAEVVFSKLHTVYLRISLILVLSAIGLINIFLLHPYQYIYYNSLVGGVSGAFRRFELDYWGTAQVELASILDSSSATWAYVFVEDTTRILENYYLRPDLIVENNLSGEVVNNWGNSYLILNSKYNNDLNLLPEAEVIASVERGGATLGVIKSVSIPFTENDQTLPLKDKDSLLFVDDSFSGILGIGNLIPGDWEIESADGCGYYWLGEGEIQGLRGFIWSEREIPARIIIYGFAGPNRDDSIRNIGLNLYSHPSYDAMFDNRQFDGSRNEIFTFDGTIEVDESVNLTRGWNEFQIYCLDRAKIDYSSSGDLRPLLVMIQEIRVEPFDNVVELIQLNESLQGKIKIIEDYLPEWGLENVSGPPFLWMGRG
jgi:hypothetical protein